MSPGRHWPAGLLGPRLRILMYHSVLDNPRDPHALHPEAFARQMESLGTRRAPVVPLNDAVAELGLGARGRGPALAITFDDAYEDFLANAAPVLLRHRFPATVFVPTGLLGGTASWDSHDPAKRLMDWDGLREVRGLGFAVGSHSVTHPRLTECDDARLAQELRGSLDSLREHLDSAVPILAYPGGYYGRREMRAARAAGYVAAVGVASRWPNYAWTNRYRLRRCRWPA